MNRSFLSEKGGERTTWRGDCRKFKVHDPFRQSRVAQGEQGEEEVAKDDAIKVRRKVVKGPLCKHKDLNWTL